MDTIQQHGLSQRERQILMLVAQGATNHAIAAALGIGRSTVEHHLTAIFEKCRVSNRTAAVIKAIAAGWITLH